MTIVVCAFVLGFVNVHTVLCIRASVHTSDICCIRDIVFVACSTWSRHVCTLARDGKGSCWSGVIMLYIVCEVSVLSVNLLLQCFRMDCLITRISRETVYMDFLGYVIT